MNIKDHLRSLTVTG